MPGGRAPVAISETLWRHLFAANSRDQTSFTAFSLIRAPGDLSLRRSAMQGFEENYRGSTARHDYEFD